MKKLFLTIAVLFLSCTTDSTENSPGIIQTGGIFSGGTSTGGESFEGVAGLAGSSGGADITAGNSSIAGSSSAGNGGKISTAGISGFGGNGGSSYTGGSGTIDVGSGGTIDVGSGGTVDVGSGGTVDVGSGGTIDTGSGGTIDTGSGGTIDTGSGGTIDTGSGGTVDTCIPTCTPDILGSGEKAVNLVVFEDAIASGCDTEGRMWVGGNADLSGYGVGMQLIECDSEDPVLVVGGDLTINGGVKGRIWVGGVFSGTAPQCGGVWDNEPPPVDFEEVTTTLTSYSNLLAGYPVNGTAEYNGSVLVLEGTDDYINVVEITGQDLEAAGSIVINAPIDSSFIVNVTGVNAGFSNGTVSLPDGIECGSGGVELNDFCNRLIWNFPEAEILTVGGIAVQGSVLAPNATMMASGSGQINGAVIVKNFNISACIEMHPHYFNGCLCTEEVESVYACCP